MEVQIFDINGKKVAQRNYYSKEEKEQYKFDLSRNDKGVFVVNLIVGDSIKTTRIRLK